MAEGLAKFKVPGLPEPCETWYKVVGDLNTSLTPLVVVSKILMLIIVCPVCGLEEQLSHDGTLMASASPTTLQGSMKIILHTIYRKLLLTEDLNRFMEVRVHAMITCSR